MKSFLLMLCFFTRLPFGKKVQYSHARFVGGLKFFPLTGLITGILMSIPFFLPLNASYRALLVLLAYIFLTGGIHLDGLSDAIDGLLSHRSKERMLEIMRDSRIGAYGALSLILYVLTFYVSAQSLTFEWIVLMPFIGKTMGLFSASLSDYARDDEGMGRAFIATLKPIKGYAHALIALAVSLYVLGTQGLVALLLVLLATVYVTRTCKQKIGGMTGDTIGMVIEVTQLIFLVTGGIIWQFI